MTPISRSFETDDVSLSYYEWGNPEDPTILFIHATGMHARVWDKTINALPTGYHVIAMDQRGHGKSQSDVYLTDWTLLASDACKFIEGLGLTDIIGVGHSMGGHVLTQVALQHPDRFKRLILIDPVIFPPERYGVLTDFEKGHPKDNPIARRRNEFDDWQDMMSVFSTRTPYSDWQPEILEDYCRYGVKPNADATGYCLACDPDIEASVYMGHAGTNVLKDIHKLSLPVTVLRARDANPDLGKKIDFSASPTWEKLASAFPNGRDVPLKHLTHFIPMQDPELVAKYILLK